MIPNKIRIFTLCALLSVPAFAQTTKTVVLNKASAEHLSLALLNSGFAATVSEDGSRSIVDAHVVTVRGISQHECDDSANVLCGFKLPARLQIADQKEVAIEWQEELQLTKKYAKLVDPILVARKINNQDAATGKVYSDYGLTTCTWKVSKNYPFAIRSPRCVLKVPDYSL